MVLKHLQREKKVIPKNILVMKKEEMDHIIKEYHGHGFWDYLKEIEKCYKSWVDGNQKIWDYTIMDLNLQKSYGFKEAKDKKESLIKKTYDTYEKSLMQKPCVGGISEINNSVFPYDANRCNTTSME